MCDSLRRRNCSLGIDKMLVMLPCIGRYVRRHSPKLLGGGRRGRRQTGMASVTSTSVPGARRAAAAGDAHLASASAKHNHFLQRNKFVSDIKDTANLSEIVLMFDCVRCQTTLSRSLAAVPPPTGALP